MKRYFSFMLFLFYLAISTQINAGILHAGIPTDSSFVLDEILIKLKDEPSIQSDLSSKGNIAAGLPFLDELNRRYGVTSMKKIIGKVMGSNL